MAEAKTSSARYLADESPEAIEANRRYQEAATKLSESLDSRKNQFFDPVMLAMAQGFLAPTQTGGFGEALGNVAGKVGAAQEIESKKDQDIAQQRFALAGQGVELQRSKSDYAAGQEYLRRQGMAVPGQPPAPSKVEGGLPKPSPAPEMGAPPAIPTGALSRLEVPSEAAPAAAPAAAPPTRLQPPPAAQGPLPTAADKPRGYENIQGIPIMPPNPSITTKNEHVAQNLGRKPLAELLKEGEEMERHRWQKTETGMMDLRTGLEYPKASAERIDMPIFGEGYDPNKTYSVPKSVAIKLGQLQMAGDEEAYKALADKATGKSFGKKPGEEPAPVLSVEERALKSKKAETLQGAEVAQEIEDRKNFIQRARDADESITTANVFRRFAADPDAKKMFGILNNDKVSSGIATLVKEGVGIPGFTVGTKAIEDVMRNADLNPEQVAKYRTFLMYAAQMQLQQTKYMKGSVSDFEQRLMGSAGITAGDTPETIRMKADLITRRAQFDRRVAKAFKGSKMTADEFLDSDKYSDMRDKYNEDLADLTSGSKILVPASTAVKAAPGKNLEAAKKRVDDILRK